MRQRTDNSQGSDGEGLAGGQMGWTKCLYFSGAGAWGGDGIGVSGEAAGKGERGQRDFLHFHLSTCGRMRGHTCTRTTYQRVECEWRARRWWPECVQSAGSGPAGCVPGGGSAWDLRRDLQTTQHNTKNNSYLTFWRLSSSKRTKYNIVLASLNNIAISCWFPSAKVHWQTPHAKAFLYPSVNFLSFSHSVLNNRRHFFYQRLLQ